MQNPGIFYKKNERLWWEFAENMPAKTRSKQPFCLLERSSIFARGLTGSDSVGHAFVFFFFSVLFQHIHHDGQGTWNKKPPTGFSLYNVKSESTHLNPTGELAFVKWKRAGWFTTIHMELKQVSLKFKWEVLLWRSKPISIFQMRTLDHSIAGAPRSRPGFPVNHWKGNSECRMWSHLRAHQSSVCRLCVSTYKNGRPPPAAPALPNTFTLLCTKPERPNNKQQINFNKQIYCPILIQITVY